MNIMNVMNIMNSMNIMKIMNNMINMDIINIMIIMNILNIMNNMNMMILWHNGCYWLLMAENGWNRPWFKMVLFSKDLLVMTCDFDKQCHCWVSKQGYISAYPC